MNGKRSLTNASAARIIASTFGILAGLGGLTHGIGETLQGNVAPDGIFVKSWTQGPIATNMGGEPGITLVPNLLVTGILTIVVSLAAIVWSVAFVQRKRGGLVLILLSVAMLLVGGGVGPPVIGVLAGVAGLGIHAPHTWSRGHLPTNVRRFLAAAWPWVFGACAVNGAFLVVGSVVLVYLFGLNNADLFLWSFYFAVVSLLAAVFTGIAYDVQRQVGNASAVKG